MTNAKLVPELVCSDLDRSLEFYTSVLGFSILYQRQEERFVYLEREGAEIMLEDRDSVRSSSATWSSHTVEESICRSRSRTWTNCWRR